MTELTYTDPTEVKQVLVEEAPPSRRSVTGYGGQIPVRFKVLYLGHWRRVYGMCYGNAASMYVKVRGANVFLDLDTEHRLDEAAS